MSLQWINTFFKVELGMITIRYEMMLKTIWKYVYISLNVIYHNIVHKSEHVSFPFRFSNVCVSEMLLISRQSHKKGNIRTTSYTFLDNFNILKRFYGLCFFTGSDPINQWFLVKTIDKRVSEAQKK